MGFLSVIPDGARSNGSGLSCLTRSLNAVRCAAQVEKLHLNGYFKFKEADSMTMLAQSLGWQGLPLMIICAAIDAPSAWALPPIALGVVRLLVVYTAQHRPAAPCPGRGSGSSLQMTMMDSSQADFWRRTVPVYAPFPSTPEAGRLKVLPRGREKLSPAATAVQ